MNKKKNKMLLGGVFLAFIVVGLYFWVTKTKTVEIGVKQLDINTVLVDVNFPSDGLSDRQLEIQQDRITKTREKLLEAPDDWLSWIAVGNAYRMLNDYDTAISAYNKSIALQPNNILGYANIADIYRLDIKNYDKAATYYSLALENNFSDKQIYITLAKVYKVNLKVYDHSEGIYVRGLSRFPGNIELTEGLLDLYKDTNEKDKFNALRKTLLDSNPGNEQLLRRYPTEL
jgi:tetratricopeptide (TPR) repeat protein